VFMCVPVCPKKLMWVQVHRKKGLIQTESLFQLSLKVMKDRLTKSVDRSWVATNCKIWAIQMYSWESQHFVIYPWTPVTWDKNSKFTWTWAFSIWEPLKATPRKS
jgi:hypothetical protein